MSSVIETEMATEPFSEKLCFFRTWDCRSEFTNLFFSWFSSGLNLSVYPPHTLFRHCYLRKEVTLYPLTCLLTPWSRILLEKL